MARQIRFSLPHQCKYIVQKGNISTPIFSYNDDFEFYLYNLKELCNRYDCKIHAYSLLTDQVHLLITPASSNAISKVMQSLGRTYTKYYNQYYDRSGTLWDGRYRASLVSPTEYLLTCMLYIEQSPVRERLVKQAHEYNWSSTTHNMGITNNSFITPHEAYVKLGQSDLKRHEAYRSLIKLPLPGNETTYILNAINGGWVMGGHEYSKLIEELSQRRAQPRNRGGDRRSLCFNNTINKNKDTA